ncbi:MAG TPA: glucose 1-dehydrogenase [Methylomirabilota bacterium]|jgi:NAD(P)-dependent dehydrogenase (short-subunit alcohol dehydrogenase family)
MTASAETTYRSLFDLNGRVALVAGGGGGLGREIARGLADWGARLLIADRDLPRAETVSREIVKRGGLARALMVDVTSPDSVRSLVQEVVAVEGRVDVLVNAAGILEVAPAVDLSFATWSKVLDVNLTGVFLMSQAVGAVMLRQGRGKVINIASVSSTVANPGYAAYAASKGGVAQLTRVLGLEWCRHGIQVNAIGPAFTETDLTRPYLAADDTRRQFVLSKIPAGRLGEPADLVGVAVFLASAASDFVVGQMLYVDGGRTLG